MSSEHFDTTDADIILRSADGQEFRAHKRVLSLASRVFRNVLTSPLPPSPEPPSISVVDVSETGKVLDVFLRCLYPEPKPTPEGFELLEGLIAAAGKYEADVVFQMTKPRVVTPENLRRDPFRVYVIVCAFSNLYKQAEVAAQCMTLDTIVSAPLDMVARLTTAEHHRLTVYLMKREEEAERAVEEPPWSMLHSTRCVCTTATNPELGKDIKKTLLDAYISNPPLSVETAVVLARAQSAKVPPCRFNEDCSLGAQGETYARVLARNLVEMSNRLY